MEQRQSKQDFVELDSAGEIVTAIDSLTKEELVAVMNEYHNGNREKAVDTMVKSMKKYIMYLVTRKFSTYVNDREDLISEGVIGVLKGMADFNPEKGSPTTFFHSYIIHEIQGYIDTNIHKTTTHYASKIKKIQKSIAKLEAKGVDWNLQTIIVDTGESANTITSTMEIINNSNVMHYDNFDAIEERINDFGASPEDLFILGEQNEAVSKALENLSEEERIVISLWSGYVGSGLSIKKIEETTGFKGVQRIKTRAARKMKNTLKKHPYFQERALRTSIIDRSGEISLIPLITEEDEKLEFKIDEIDLTF